MFHKMKEIYLTGKQAAILFSPFSFWDKVSLLSLRLTYIYMCVCTYPSVLCVYVYIYICPPTLHAFYIFSTAVLYETSWKTETPKYR